MYIITIAITINFISSNILFLLHSKINNTEFLTSNNANDVVDELFNPLLSRYKLSEIS